jgi:hypothetical protein
MLLTERVRGRGAKPAVAAPISLFERKRKGQNIFSHELADVIAQILASLTEDRRLLIRLVPKMLTGVE